MARITRRAPPLVFLAVACLAAGMMLENSTSIRLAAGTAQPEGPALGFSFAEVAEAAGLTAKTVFGGQKTNRYLLETTGSGVAVLDYDGDDWLDVFVVNGTTLEGFPKGQEPTSHLYRNRRNGSFEDVTAKAGLIYTGWGQGACAGDYDNDGDDDLFVTYWGQNRLYRNRGNGTFDEVTRAAGLVGTPPAALGRRVRLPRLRPRRPSRSVRRQLHRLQSGRRPRPGVGPVPLQRRAGRVRAARVFAAARICFIATRETARSPTCPRARDHPGERHVRLRRQHARLRRRRVGGRVRGERLEPERALPEQSRRHVHRYRRGVGLRVQPGRQTAGGDGRGGG